MRESVELFENIFSARRVLVTGHTGFKGSWLALWLQSLGAEVTGFALEPATEPNLFDALRLADSITHVIGDIREPGALENLIRRQRPQIIFHLAAQPLVRFSYQDPILTYDTNVMGTVRLLEAARQVPEVRVIVNVTSDKCYENREWDYAYRENDAMGGFDPYSSSKGCAELVTAAYRASFLTAAGVQLASARAGNVVGGGDWAPDRIVPDCIRALVNGKEIVVRNPAAVRPWQYVLEPLAGYLLLASRLWRETPGSDAAWNFGPQARSNIPVQGLVEKLIAEWGEGGWSTPPAGQAELHEAKFLKLDCTKANNLLEWHSLYGMDRIMQATTAWYKSFYQGEEMLPLSLREIEAYVSEAVRQRAPWARAVSTEAGETA